MTSLTAKQSGRLAFALWLGLVIGMSALVPQAMAAHPWAQAFADFMAQCIPMLDGIHKIPGETEWLRLFYAVFWAVSPVFAYMGWRMRRRQCSEGSHRQPLVDVTLILVVLGVLAFCTLALVWPAAPGTGWRDQFVLSNILGVAHFSFLCAIVLFGLGMYGWLIYERFLECVADEDVLDREGRR